MPRCRSLSSLLLLALVIPALGASPAHGATFVVTSADVTSDVHPGDGVCDDGTDVVPVCTLRAAIDEANADPGPDRIQFAIPGSGPHVISDQGLVITWPVVIDGTTQPGASKNTAATGTNAVLAIVLQGDFSAAGGILAEADNVELRGLALRDTSLMGTCAWLEGARARVLGSRFECGAALYVIGDNARIGGAPSDRNLISSATDQTAITLSGNGSFVANNLIGTDANGTRQLPPFDGIFIGGSHNTITDNWIEVGGTGVYMFFSPPSDSNTVARNRIRGAGDASSTCIYVGGNDNQIGLPSPTHTNANQISGCYYGVRLEEGGSGNRVQGNLIGVEADGTPSAPNDSGVSNYYGIWMADVRNSTIGEPVAGTPGAGNWIAFNLRGVVLRNTGHLGNYSLDNSLRANRIWGQTELNLDLGEDLSRNDDGGFPPDQDEGPNHLQNPPRISSVTRSGGTTRIQGVIAAQTGSFTLDFYSNDDCALMESGLPPGIGHGGKFYLGAAPAPLVALPTLAVSLTSFDVTLPLNAPGNGFTAMATDASGNSSEFSECFSSVQAQAALSVAVTADRSGASVGDDVVFTVALTNAGPLAATGVSVHVPRPAVGFSNWTADPAGSYDESTGQWLAGDLASGATTTLTLTGRVASGAPDTIEVQAVAGQGSAQVDPDPSDNTSSARIRVLTGAHLRLSQTVVPASAGKGEIVTFEIGVTNDGPDNARGIVLSGHFDEGLVYLDDPTTQDWTVDFGDLAQGEVGYFTVDAQVAETAVLGAGLSHTVSASTGLPDDPPQLATAVVAAGTAADLAVASIHPVGNSLIVTIANHGPDPVSGLTLWLTGATNFDLLPEACTEVSTTPPPVVACVFLGILPNPLEVSVPIYAQLTATVGSAAAAPYFERNPMDNTLLWTAPPRPCGLTGIEAVFAIGLLALVRRKLRRLPVAALLLALWTGGAESARALPITFAVDTAASSASFALASPLGSPLPVLVSLSGSANADVALAVHPSFGLVATSLRLSGASLDFSDASILLSSPSLYALTFAGRGLGASVSGPLANGFPVGAGLSLFDLGGSALVFDTGAIDATGTYYGLPIDMTLDLALTPLTSVFPTNSAAQLRVMDLGGGNASLRLSFPFSAPLRITVDDLESTVTISGTLVLNGAAEIPEPASGLLVGCGLAWLVVARRRAAAKRA